MSQEEPLLKAREVVKAIGIPQATLYRLTREGAIPSHNVTQDWHKRKHVAWKLSEVRAALARLGADRA